MAKHFSSVLSFSQIRKVATSRSKTTSEDPTGTRTRALIKFSQERNSHSIENIRIFTAFALVPFFFFFLQPEQTSIQLREVVTNGEAFFIVMPDTLH